MRRFLFFIILIVIIGFVATRVMTSAPSSNAEPVDFTIANGQGVKAVAQNLKDSGLIKSTFVFEVIVWLGKLESKVQAGDYLLSTDMKPDQILDIIVSGGATSEFRVTFIEGWTLDEYKDYLEKKRFDVSNFDELAADVSSWQESYDFLEELGGRSTLEGYLFPDTYNVGTDKDLEELFTKMLDNFARKIPLELRQKIIEDSNRSLHEVITLASIVESEAAGTEDRRKVADVFYKRLEIGQGLESDATINYLTKSGRSRSTASDLEIDSPYNTYKYRGLPPGPIGNPSLDAIMAVINPIQNNFYYFLTDIEGNVYYAETFNGHQQNREKHL